MLSDPGTARFITVDGKPVVDEMTGWRHAVVMAGHWVLHGAGMFVVEEKSSGKFAGRVGPWWPPGWPGFEVGWGIAREFRGKGYAVEAARASIDWAFATYDIDRIVHCIDRENIASQGVARRLGAKGSRNRIVRPCRGHLGDEPREHGGLNRIDRASRKHDAGGNSPIAGRAASPSRRDRIAPATGSRRRTDRRGRSAPGGRA